MIATAGHRQGQRLVGPHMVVLVAPRIEGGLPGGQIGAWRPPAPGPAQSLRRIESALPRQNDPFGSAGLTIPEQLFRIGDAVPMPMRRGSVLFMHRLTCHGSLSNRSERVRRSMDLRYNPIGQHSGRDAFPGFVSHSRANPDSELDDPQVWARLWRQAHNRLAGAPDPSCNRWSSDDPACA